MAVTGNTGAPLNLGKWNNDDIFNFADVNTSLDAINTFAGGVNTNISGIQSDMETLATEVSSATGKGGALVHNDFGSNLDPTDPDVQSAFIEYAFEQVKGAGGTFTFNAANPGASTYAIGGTTYPATDIWNGTWVRNDADNHRWVLNNTDDTVPIVYEWTDVGIDTVSVATTDTAGVVTSAAENLSDGDVVVDPVSGKMTAPGKQSSLTTSQLAAVNSGITADKVSKYDKTTFILPPNSDRVCDNVIISDDTGVGGVYVRIPKFKLSDVITGGADVTHPAFIVGGMEKDEIFIGKYQAVVRNNRAYSVPFVDPTVNIDFDTAKAACRAKGRGHHLITNAEWAALALWCKKHGLMPHGNNQNTADCGDLYFPDEKMIRASTATGTNYRGYTGTGPVTFSHNYHESGVYDLNGNVWEWNDGLRVNNGEIQILPNNDAALSTSDSSPTSAQWKAILPDGTLVPPGTAGTLKYDCLSPGTTWPNDASGIRVVTTLTSQTTDTNYCCPQFGNVQSSLVGVGMDLLKQLALFPDGNADAHGKDTFWLRNNGEQLPRRGGRWNDGASAGVFALALHSPRSHVNAAIGFRSAFIDVL